MTNVRKNADSLQFSLNTQSPVSNMLNSKKSFRQGLDIRAHTQKTHLKIHPKLNPISVPCSTNNYIFHYSRL